MLRIYGASDDLVEVEGSIKGDPDEISAYDHHVTLRVGGDPDGDTKTPGCIVHVWYAGADACPDAPGGTWTVAVTLLDEDEPLPWPMRLVFDKKACAYSPVLEIECPHGTRVTQTYPEPDKDE